MARLTINSYQGDAFAVSFNDEITGKTYFDVSEWADSALSVYSPQGFTRDQLVNAWTIGKKSIRFAITAPFVNDNNGQVTTDYIPIFAEWGGKFKLQGDRIISGTVTRFNRDWGKSYGNIAITGIKYALKGEMGSLWSLTLPNEITNHFDGTIGPAQINQYGAVSNTVLSFLSNQPAGSSYDFSTPYG